MRALRDRRGAGGIGCLLMIAIVAAGIYSGLEWGMPRFRHVSFEERLSESFPYFSKQPEESIRKRIIQIAAEFDIALTPQQVKLLIRGDNLTIDIDYQKTVDLKVWQKTYPFHSHHNGPY